MVQGTSIKATLWRLKQVIQDIEFQIRKSLRTVFWGMHSIFDLTTRGSDSIKAPFCRNESLLVVDSRQWGLAYRRSTFVPQKISWLCTQAPMVFYWGGTHSCRFQNHIWLWGALQCPSIRDMNPFLHKSPWLRFDGSCWVWWGCKKPKISKKIRGWLVKCGTHVTHHPQEWRRTPTQDASQLVLGNTCRTSGVHHFECVQG